jgi:hypothetical protein
MASAGGSPIMRVDDVPAFGDGGAASILSRSLAQASVALASWSRGLQWQSAPLAARMAHALRVRSNLPSATGHGAAQHFRLRASPPRSTRPTGQIQPCGGNPELDKKLGQRQKFIRSLGKQLKQCAEKIFYTNKKYQQIIDGTSVDRSSSEPRCCARRRSTPEAFSKYSRATP